MPLSLRPRPFSQILLVSIVALIVLVLVGITVVDYAIAERNLRDHQALIQDQTETDLVNAIELVDEGLKLFDDTLNVQMQDGLEQFVAEYERVGRDPAALDLERLKHEVFGDTMDLYVINESNMVEFTTYPPDQDLDFGAEWGLDDYLAMIRAEGGFFPDRVVREADSSILRKYAYMPTPDRRYVLELGLIGERFRKQRQELQYTATIEDVKALNPYVEDIRVFTVYGKQVGNKSFKPDDEFLERIDRVVASKSSFSMLEPGTGRKTVYRYVDLFDEDYASDLSMVLELTFNPRPIQEALTGLVFYHGMAALLALLLGLLTANFVTNRLTSPIRGLVGDVDAIAQGDLDHPVAPSQTREFSVLGTSIASMVGQLKGTIEQLRQHQVSLSESEDRYRRTLDLVSDYAYSMERQPDGSWRRVWESGNPGPVTGEMSGPSRTPEEWSALVHPDDRGLFEEHLRRIEANEPHQSEFRVLAGGGETRWFNYRTMPVRDPVDGHVRAYYAVGHDVTDRKLNEIALRESEEKYRQLVEDANSIILRLGPDGGIWYVNEYAEQFFGYEPGELLGRDAIGTIVPETDEEGNPVGDIVHGICRDPSEYTINQNENMRKDGSRVFVSWTNRAIHDDDGTPLGILCIGNDITRLKEAEGENRRLTENLEERVRQRTEDLAATNRELESFTYTVSHDLRAPLRAIDGYTYILLNEHRPELSDTARRYLEQISENARRMARLIDDLLNFSRMGRQSMNLREVDLSDLVNEVLGELGGERQGRDVRITTAGLASCRGDPALVKQIYSNLIGNALKFTRAREVAEIDIGSVERDGEQIFFVRDNGVGFDQKYAGTLFKVFHRLHDAREYEGTGVGLAIVKRIVERHGGRIWVESEEDRGTTFYFTLGEENGDGDARGEGHSAG